MKLNLLNLDPPTKNTIENTLSVYSRVSWGQHTHASSKRPKGEDFSPLRDTDEIGMM